MPVLKIEMLLANGNGAAGQVFALLYSNGQPYGLNDSKQVSIKLCKNRRVDTLVVVLKGEMKC